MNIHGFTTNMSSISSSMPPINQLASSLSASSLSPNRKYYNNNNKQQQQMQNLIQPNTWLIEEVERKRMTTNQPNGSLMTSQQHILLNQNYIDQQKQ